MHTISKLIQIFAVATLLVGSQVHAYPHQPQHHHHLQPRDSSGKLVFCHFMIGVVADRSSASDYDGDMQKAKAAGIDAFALNIGKDSYTDQQLGFAYESAAKNDMNVFISFDFNWWDPSSDAAKMGAKIKQYGTQAAQLKVDGGKIFVSSFAGDALDVDTVRSSAGIPLFIAPNFQPSNAGKVDGVLNWMAWDSNGANKAPSPQANVTVSDGDHTYMSALQGKPYIAPASPWFFTHFGPEVSYSKNWVFPADLLWYDRWNEILALDPHYVEIITWNDYGESHYVGPLSSPHTDDGNSKWTNDMPHDGWLEMAKPFIAAYKAGSKAPSINSDQLIYWYRPNSKSVDCDSTDTTTANDGSTENSFKGKPNGGDDVADSVFVVSLLKEAGTVVVNSGSNSKSVNAPAGAYAFAVPMGVGKQSFSLRRGTQTVMSETSLKDIVDSCICGIYNFNAYVGTVPAGPSEPLPPSGLQSLTVGLHVQTCKPTPTLGTAPIAGPSAPAANDPTSVPESSTPQTTSVSASVPVITISAPALSGASASHASTSTSVSSQTVLPSTTAVPLPAPALAANAGKGGRTITASAQLAPTNCLLPSDVWVVPPPSATPDHCDIS